MRTGHADSVPQPGLRAALRALRLLAALVAFGAPLGAPAQGEPAGVRIAHMSPDAPLIDVLIGTAAHLRDMAFGEVSPYLALPPGDYEIRVFPHRPPLQSPAQAEAATGGQDQAAGEDAAFALEPITIVATLQARRYYTVVLSGFYEPPAGPARSGALSVDLSPPDARLQVNGPLGYSASFTGEQLLPNLEPGPYTVTVSKDGYQTARYETRVQPGTTTIVSVNLQRGQAEAEAAAARETRQSSQSQHVELHVYEDEHLALPAAGAALVRLIHASPVTPALRAVAVPAEPDAGPAENPAVIAEDLAFPNSGSYVALPHAGFALELNAQGSGQLLAQLPAAALEPGAVYTLFLVGDPADSYAKLIPNVDATVGP